MTNRKSHGSQVLENQRKQALMEEEEKKRRRRLRVDQRTRKHLHKQLAEQARQ